MAKVMKKSKFRPRITRVKLNPEQSVLACNCFGGRLRWNANYLSPTYYGSMQNMHGLTGEGCMDGVNKTTYNGVNPNGSVPCWSTAGNFSANNTS